MPKFLKVNKPKSKEMNYSQCKRAALQLLGPTARVWQNDSKPTIQVGFENNPGRQILGAGDNFKDALEGAVKKFTENLTEKE